MALKLTVSKNVLVPIKGEMRDDAGKEVPFSFSLVCVRLPQADIDARVKRMRAGDATDADLMTDVTVGWRAVLDDDGAEIEFSADGLQTLLATPGMASLAVSSYAKVVGAKGREKN